MAAPSHPPVFWRFVICELDGTPISIVTSLANDVLLQYRLNRPAMLSFSVPSDDPLVNILHTDDYPYVSCGNRVVKGFRKVPPGEVNSPGGWQIEYVGRIWQIGDQGDGDTTRTSVTCYDPLKVLEKRLVRNSAGSAAKQVKFWGEPGTDIIQTLIDRTHTFKGATGIEDVSLGTWETSSDQTAAYDQAFVLPAIIALCDTGTCDLDITYLNTTSGDHIRVEGVERRGEDKPGVIFGYAAPPRTADRYDRTINLDNLANDLTFWGKSVLGRTTYVSDAASKATYGTFEDAQVLADVETAELVEMLADQALALRKNPQDLVTVIPAPEISAQPINDWWLGDTIRVNASKQPFPVTRQVVTGVQRVYGVDLSIDPDYGERVSNLIVSAQAE